MFRSLQELLSFVPLQARKMSKFRLSVGNVYCKYFITDSDFAILRFEKFVDSGTDFDENVGISRNLLTNLTENFVNNPSKIDE